MSLDVSSSFSTARPPILVLRGVSLHQSWSLEKRHIGGQIKGNGRNGICNWSRYIEIFHDISSIFAKRLQVMFRALMSVKKMLTEDGDRLVLQNWSELSQRVLSQCVLEGKKRQWKASFALHSWLEEPLETSPGPLFAVAYTTILLDSYYLLLVQYDAVCFNVSLIITACLILLNVQVRAAVASTKRKTKEIPKDLILT